MVLNILWVNLRSDPTVLLKTTFKMSRGTLALGTVSTTFEPAKDRS